MRARGTLPFYIGGFLLPDFLQAGIFKKDNQQKMTFRDKEALRKYENEHGKRKYDTQIWGVDVDIVLEIKVPQNMSTRIDAEYGMVEVKVFDGPLVRNDGAARWV